MHPRTGGTRHGGKVVCVWDKVFGQGVCGIRENSGLPPPPITLLNPSPRPKGGP